MPNLIVTDVDLQKSKIQTITQKLEKTHNEKELLIQKSKALKLMNQQLITQLDEKIKQLDRKQKKVEQLRRELRACKANKVHAKRMKVISMCLMCLADWTQ